MVTAPQIINLFLHLTIQTRHPDKNDFQVLRLQKRILKPCSEIIMGEELEKLKVTVCDVSLEPRLGIKDIELHVLKLNSKETGSSCIGQNKLQKQLTGIGEDKNYYLILSCAGLLPGGCR